MGLGVLSVAPSQAASQADSLTLSSATASQLTGETLTATSATTTLSFLGGNVGDTMSVSAFLTSAPAGNTVLPTLVLGDTTSALVGSSAQVTNLDAKAKVGQVAYVAAAASTKAVSAKFSVYMDGPTLPGTYVVKLTPAVTSGGGVLNATTQTLTITVTTDPNSSTVATSATIILNKGETASATTDDVVTASKTPEAATAAATIKVSLLNAAGKAVNAESFTATISGAGTLGNGANAVTSGLIVGPNATGRALTAVNGDVIQVFADGTSGVGTVTITSQAGVVLGTKSVTFYGDATVATATVIKPIINASNTQNAILVTMKDAAGTNVTNATTFYVTSSDTTKIAGAYAVRSSVSYSTTNTVGGVALGAGYLITVDGVAAGTANITVGTKSSATATTGIEAAPVAIRVGSETPASVSVTLDKSTYAPGEKATLTVVLKDATGLELADRTYASIFAAGGIVADYSLSGSLSDTTTATGVDGFASGKKEFTIYMPNIEGDVTFSWTTGSTAASAGAGLATANQAVKGSVKATVSSAGTAAALDAANEATDAANAATDAALAAADAADAATAAAEDASAAVAKLAKSVNTQLKALKKQLTSLIALVNKLR